MTARELIKELEKHDPDKEVMISDGNGNWLPTSLIEENVMDYTTEKEPVLIIC